MGGGVSTLKGVSYVNSLSLWRLAHLCARGLTFSQGGRLACSPGGLQSPRVGVGIPAWVLILGFAQTAKLGV